MKRLFGWFLPMSCKRCGGNLYEEEIFREDKKQLVEIKCLHCARSFFVDYKKYREWRLT